MADNPYGKAKKGESAFQKQARQKKFYSYQRESAEETGDQATTDKIYKKLGKKSHSVDADAVNKGILGGVASTFGLGGLGRLGKVAGAAGKAMRGMRAAKTVGRGAQEYQPTMARRLGASSGPKPGQKALPGGKGPKMAEEKPMTMGGKKAPGSQNKPIYKGSGSQAYKAKGHTRNLVPNGPKGRTSESIEQPYGKGKGRSTSLVRKTSGKSGSPTLVKRSPKGTKLSKKKAV